MSCLTRALLIPAVMVILGSVVLGSNPLQAQEDTFQGYGPRLGMKMDPTPGNPFIGAWMTRIPEPGGNGNLEGVIEYLPDGTFRSETYFEGGLMNRAKIQIWGRYAVEQVDRTHYRLAAKAVGIAPQEFCVHEGECKPNTLPDAVVETDEMIDPDNFHSKFTAQQVEIEADVHRTYLPVDFGQLLADSIHLPVPQAGPPMPDPDRYHVPTGDGRCDNLQQRRICTVRYGRMVSNRQGCEVCVDLDSPDPKPDTKPGAIAKPDPEPDLKPAPPTQ